MESIVPILMRIALKCAYDGIEYHGYARQPDVPTVENDIIQVLKENQYISDPKKNIFQSASRTDKGVSSLGNIISFNTTRDSKHILDEINECTNLIFYGKTYVNDTFYPRYAYYRHYRYYLPHYSCDKDTLIHILSLFVGTHDFTNFSRLEPMKNPIRTIENIILQESESFFIIDFFAQTYLWQQIRRIISSIHRINRQKIKASDIKNALEHPETPIDYGVAPANLLILSEVYYKQISFDINPMYEKKKKQLEERLLHRFKSLVF